MPYLITFSLQWALFLEKILDACSYSFNLNTYHLDAVLAGYFLFKILSKISTSSHSVFILYDYQ